MSSSKRFIFSILASGFLFNLMGCWKPSSTDKSETAAFSGDSKEDLSEAHTNFTVFKAGGDSLPTKEASPEWKLALARHYDFYACLKDRATRNLIIGIPFRVRLEDLAIDVRTDENGCLHWQERIPIADYFGDELYMELERVIEAEGIYNGPRKVKIAINPWAAFRKSGNREIIWLQTGGEVPQGIKLIGKEQVRTVLHKGGSVQYQNQSVEAIPQAKTKELWMDNVSIQVQSNKEVDGGYFVEVNLTMNPLVKIGDLVGSPTPIPLKSGKFMIYANIVATNLGLNRDQTLNLTGSDEDFDSNGNYIANSGMPPSVGVITEGDSILRVNLKTLLSRRTTHGNLQLALRAVPINGPVGLAPFEGLYEIGSFDKIESKQTKLMVNPRVYSEGSRFDYDEYLRNTSNFAALEKTNQAFKNRPFWFPTIHIKFETIRPGETATTRTVEYSIDACVRDMNTGREVKGEMFYVRYIDDPRSVELEKSFYAENPELIDLPDKQIHWCAPGEKPSKDSENRCKEIYMTDDSGCLRIIGHVTHRYYEPEALYFPKIEVRQVANSRSGEEFNTELELAINPWDLFATFGRDRRILSDDYIEQIAKREKIPSLLYINQFSYQTLRFRYEIDDFMNLMVKKVLLYKLEPYVLRYSSIVDGRRAMGSIRDGIYLLKVAVEKDYLDPAAKGIIIARDSATGKTRVLNGDKVKKKQYINGIKKLVRVQDGKVITPVEFSMRDLRLMRIRSNMIVQLETIDEKKLRKINVLHDQLKELVSPELEGNLRNLLAKELDDIAVNRAEMEDKKGRDEISASRYMRALMAPIQKYMNNLKNDNVSQGCREATEASPISSIEKCYDEYEFKQALPEDFFDKVRKLTIDAYRKNDLTYVSLAPLVDLDKLVENDSGLKARAFAGPVTLLLNSNQSYIRPLDNLDEAYCSNDDCKQEIDDEIAKLEGKEGPSEKEDNRYRDSPFFGSIKHLIKKKVDFFLDKMVDLEKAYRATNSVASLLYRYVIEANLQFVSLKDKSLEALDVEKCPSVGADMRPLADCLRPAPEVSTHLEDFLAEVNGENEPVIPDDYSSSRQLLFRNKLIDTKVLKSDLYKIIQSGDMNLEATKKLCEWYASRASDIFWTKMKSLNQRDGRSWFYYRSDQNLGFKQEILSDCVRKEIEHQKKIAGVRPNILERAKDYFWNPSEARGIFVERKLKVNRTGSYRFKGGKSMNISVSGTTEISSGEARQGSINYNVLDFIPIIGRFRLSDDYSRSNKSGTTIGEQAFLVMQEAVMDVEVLDYERCAIIRPNPELMAKVIRAGVKYFPDETDRLRNTYLRGTLVCEGENKTEPLAIRERYYYFTQHFTEGDQLDSADLYNHPWLLALRGKRDFSAFITHIRRIPYDWSLEGRQNEEGWSINHLMKTYYEVHPTFPGIYSFIEEEGEKVEYPFGSKPGDSFKEDGFSH